MSLGPFLGEHGSAVEAQDCSALQPQGGQLALPVLEVLHSFAVTLSKYWLGRSRAFLLGVSSPSLCNHRTVAIKKPDTLLLCACIPCYLASQSEAFKSLHSPHTQGKWVAIPISKEWHNKRLSSTF